MSCSFIFPVAEVTSMVSWSQ